MHSLPTKKEKLQAVYYGVLDNKGPLFIFGIFQTWFIGMIILGFYTSLLFVYFFGPISLAFAYFMGSMCWNSIRHAMDQYYFKNYSVATSGKLVKKELIDNSHMQTTANGSDRILAEPIYVEEYDYMIEYEFTPQQGMRQNAHELISKKHFEVLEEGDEVPLFYLSFDPSVSKFRGQKLMNQRRNKVD